MTTLCFRMPLAQGIGTGVVQNIVTQDSISVPIYAYWRNDAEATAVLFSGGGGGYGRIGEEGGWPAGRNFLIRSGKHWATYPFNVVMVGRPSDKIDLSLGNNRIAELHTADNVAIFKSIKLKCPSRSGSLAWR